MNGLATVATTFGFTATPCAMLRLLQNDTENDLKNPFALSVTP
jgi:hypothetical protein